MFNRGFTVSVVVATALLSFAGRVINAQDSPASTVNAIVSTLPIAAAVPATSGGMSKDEMGRRIEQLEAQMEQMQTELKLLKAASAPAAVPHTAAKETAAELRAQDRPVNPPRPGFDLGPVHVIPYGTIYVNIFGNSGGNNNADVPLFATPTGSGGFNATARETRLGLRLEGPQVGGAKSSAHIETDFTGGFPAIGIGEDFGVLRLRLAYAKLDWQRTTLEVGQDWTIFSPLNPVSLASVGAPEFAAAGNLFARIPQLKLEERWFEGRLSLAGAIVGPRTGDYPNGTTPAVLQPGGGSASRLPAFEMRIAFNDKNWFGSGKAGGIGLSGHYGQDRVATSPRVIDLDVEGISGDWSLPLGKRVTWAGEAFWGRNLAGFQGVIFQTFVPDFAYRFGNTIVPGGPRAPETRGGWTQFGLTPPITKDRLTIYGGLALDDPVDTDFVSLSRRDSRIRNLSYAVSLKYKLSPQWSWGIEYRRMETSHIVSGRQNNNHLNLSGAFSF